MSTGRALPPSSPFAADDGSCDPDLARALASGQGGEPDLAAVVAAIAGARLLVPVVSRLVDLAEAEGCATHLAQASPQARSGAAPSTGKVASASMVTLEGPDGRPVTPVFSSVETVRAWRADARPVPVEPQRVALAAVGEGAEQLVLDPGGPRTVLLPRPAVWALAQGRAWVPALADPDVVLALQEAASSVGGVREVGVAAGRRAEVRLELAVERGLGQGELAQMTSAVGRELAASEVVAERVDSVELAIRAV